MRRPLRSVGFSTILARPSCAVGKPLQPSFRAVGAFWRGARRVRAESMVGVERRQFGRRQTCVHATIALRGRPDVLCVMRDVSEQGALLEVVHPEWLPDPVPADRRARSDRERLRGRAPDGRGPSASASRARSPPTGMSARGGPHAPQGVRPLPSTSRAMSPR